MLNNLRQYLRIKRQSLVFRLLFYFILSMLIVALILSVNFTSRVKPHFKNDLLPNLVGCVCGVLGIVYVCVWCIWCM